VRALFAENKVRTAEQLMRKLIALWCDWSWDHVEGQRAVSSWGSFSEICLFGMG